VTFPPVPVTPPEESPPLPFETPPEPVVAPLPPEPLPAPPAPVNTGAPPLPEDDSTDRPDLSSRQPAPKSGAQAAEMTATIVTVNREPGFNCLRSFERAPSRRAESWLRAGR
jgi:hypothetical protein